MTVVTFENYHPSPRYDNVPWTRALIEEASTAEGAWTLIDTIVFSDPDVDPADPKMRSFTTTNATLPFGWYRVTFTDVSGGNTQPTAPVYNGADQAYEPTVDQVARKILTRTRDKYGNITGTFSDDTQPTGAQASAIIADTMTEVADVIGDDIPDSLIDDASNVVAIKAAMNIELSYYPDQVNTDRSTYKQLSEEYDKEIANLSAAVIAAEQGTDPGSVVGGGPSGYPSYSFPDSSKSLGLETRW